MKLVDETKLNKMLAEALATGETMDSFMGHVEEALHRQQVAYNAFHQATLLLQPYLESSHLTMEEALPLMRKPEAREVLRLFRLCEQQEAAALASGFLEEES